MDRTLGSLSSSIAAIGLLLANAPSPQLAGREPAEPSVHPADWPRASWPVPPSAEIEARVAALLARMTIEEKVGQVIQADIGSVTPDDIRRYHLGAILNGGNSGPGGDDSAPPAKWLALADEFYAASIDTSDGGVGVPIIWGTDAVHGHSNIVGATLFPHNIGLGAAHDPDLIERIGRATAVEVRTTGMEWTFAPTLTVPQDYRWGRAYEGYSSDPKLVAAYAGRMILGLQGSPGAGPILAGPHVMASTKHFIADGGTDGGRDQGDASIDEAALRTIHGAPYVPAIDAGVATIMASFSSWRGTKIAANKGLLTDVVKGRMAFGGFILTDWNAHGQIAGCSNDSCPRAINSGIDMYMAPDSWKPLYHSLVAQVRDGTVPMRRIDDAVARILRTKLRLGLFEAGKPSSRPYSGQFELLGSAAHRAIAREAVRKSLVLLKSQGGVLPIRAGAKLLVAGDGADDIGRQSGGWTITWQGTGVTNKDFPGGTSIWRGLEQAVRATGGQAELAPDGHFKQRPDVAIVVFGETPYAEFQGDLKTLQLRPELRSPYATMQQLKAQGIPVIAVMITGRPLFVNPELNLADAFVVAWLPGSEGEGVADLLVQGGNRPRHDFTGTLPAAWPLSARHDGPTLFNRGHGLTLAKPGAKWRQLDENPGIVDDGSSGVFLDKGVPAASWSLVVSDGAAESTRVTMLPALVLGGRGRVTATDHLVQEGARQFSFTGAGPAIVELTTQVPIDVSRETNGDVMLLITARIDTAPAMPFSIDIQCGPGCHGTVAAAELSNGAIGAWRTIGIPLKCFARAGADMSRLTAPFRLSAAGATRFSLARVALGTVADQVVDCPR